MIESKGPFPHVYPNIEDWGIYKLHTDRSNFIQEINREVFEQYKSKSNQEIAKLIANA